MGHMANPIQHREVDRLRIAFQLPGVQIKADSCVRAAVDGLDREAERRVTGAMAVISASRFARCSALARMAERRKVSPGPKWSK